MNNALRGYSQEKKYTKELNKKEKFWDKLNYNNNNTFAIHIDSKKYGFINEQKINAKADIYLAEGIISYNTLKEKDFYLCEKDSEYYKLKPISGSGISVKMPDSRYTITKISPNTFKKIFGSNILGAGASIYCNKESEFIKNIEVLKGWQIQENDFINYFKNSTKIQDISLYNKKALKEIKKESNDKIAEIIINSKKISDFIFKGIGNFKEPYTASWIIENDELKANYYIPFKITTGSGRSKGIFTIVLKPK